jgi:P27 family predicted phage terminase small subunit
LTTQRTPQPPKHLSPATRAWWRQLVAEYGFEAHEMRLLQGCCEAWDRCQQAREEVARDGLTVTTAKGGIRAHPAIGIERDSRLAFARMLRELRLSDVAEPASRPPALKR